MFTGIVQFSAPLAAVEEETNLRRLALSMSPKQQENLVTGASVALNGVCLTVSRIDADRVWFDVMAETLRLTNLGQVQAGEHVNVERAARFGDEIGGHLLSGHIHCQAEVVAIHTDTNRVEMQLQAPQPWAKYLLPKGYVAVNGASLTLGETVTAGRFSLYLIPETLKITTFDALEVGDKVNLEVDSQTQAVVDTVERVLAQRA